MLLLVNARVSCMEVRSRSWSRQRYTATRRLPWLGNRPGDCGGIGG